MIASIVLVAVAAATAGFWYLFLPNWRPPLQDGEHYGIDVSSHQDDIDWTAVARDDIEFAYIKASEGQGFVDDRFDGNWAGAGDVGLDRGAYHFFTLCASGADQARNFLDVAPPDADALPPAVDLEFAGNCSRRPSATDVAAERDAFLTLVEEAWGQDALLYIDDTWEDHYPTRENAGRPLWRPNFLFRPDGSWQVWQIHAFAHVDGNSGGVDLDITKVVVGSA